MHKSYIHRPGLALWLLPDGSAVMRTRQRVTHLPGHVSRQRDWQRRIGAASGQDSNHTARLIGLLEQALPGGS